MGLGLLTAAAWRHADPRRRGGRVVVRGRNYETNIKKKKGPAEARKARITRKHLSTVIICVREFGPNPETNPGLARAIKVALKDNVPRTTIDNRIKTFVDGKESITELTIGGYGVGGSAVMVECVTDNTNRCRTDVREAFKEIGGQVGADGCVDHVFSKQGVIRFEGVEEEKVVEAAMEAEIEDCRTRDDGSVEVVTLPENINSAAEALEKSNLDPVEQGIKYVPLTEAKLDEASSYEMKRLLFLLEDLDDVQEVHHNAALEDIELQFNPYGIPLAYKSVKKGGK